MRDFKLKDKKRNNYYYAFFMHNILSRNFKELIFPEAEILNHDNLPL